MSLEIWHKYDVSVKIYSQILIYEAKYTLAFQIVYTVVITRSKSTGVNMSITTEVCEYFENLIKSFNTDQSLEEHLCKFKAGVISFRDQTERAKFKDSRIWVHKFTRKKTRLEIRNIIWRQWTVEPLLMLAHLQYWI